ncbi:MAG: DUF3244 domain-containing protein [Tannerellaceae bacterium]|jgi:hypothetical protein|nr:DUF3244 domain-containing protein [Tannerellaceae bacterium]
MKNYHYLVVLFAFLFSINVYADEKQISVEGEWGNERVRSSAPERPIVYINNNVLSIYLADALENLAIVIIDSSGLIVYQDCLSSNGDGYTHTIWLSEQSGNYTIELSHSNGVLSGEFINP